MTMALCSQLLPVVVEGGGVVPSVLGGREVEPARLGDRDHGSRRGSATTLLGPLMNHQSCAVLLALHPLCRRRYD